jgi:hypothetical protein
MAFSPSPKAGLPEIADKYIICPQKIPHFFWVWTWDGNMEKRFSHIQLCKLL